eukprot:1563657-Prorocentrum_lima.AAC.1
MVMVASRLVMKRLTPQELESLDVVIPDWLTEGYVKSLQSGEIIAETPEKVVAGVGDKRYLASKALD